MTITRAQVQSSSRSCAFLKLTADQLLVFDWIAGSCQVNTGQLALVKGIREPHEVKEKSFNLGGNRTHDLRIRSTVTLPTELRGRTEKVGDDLGG